MDLGDIEDLISSPNDLVEERLQFDHVIARVKKVNGTTANHVNKKEYKQNKLKASKRDQPTDRRSAVASELAIDESISYTPGQATIFVKTWGCTHNVRVAFIILKFNLIASCAWNWTNLCLTIFS